MKKIFKFALLAAALVVTVGSAASCSDDVYDEKAKEGYDVTVRFDPNGGNFADTPNTVVIDAFDLDKIETDENGQKVFSIVAPEDSARGKENAKSISHNGYKYGEDGEKMVKYTFAGWYRERQPRVDENGNPLDDYGVPTSESGRRQGYVYSGRWNFSTDKIELDASGEYDIRESVLTLYAAWIPYTTFEIYDEGGSLIDSVYSTSIDIPTWNKDTGKVSYGSSISEREGMTFDAAYRFDDEEMKKPLSGIVRSKINYDNATLAESTVKIKTTWLSGEWYKVFTAKQLINNLNSDGNYILGADLDFTGEVNPFAALDEFSGSIDGNGFKIKGLSLVQNATDSEAAFALFPYIKKEAKITNLAVEDATLTVKGVGRGAPKSFGLLFRGVEEGAEVVGVTVSGVILLDIPKNQNLNLLNLFAVSADGKTLGIDISGVECKLSESVKNNFTVEKYDDGEIYVFTAH